QPAVRRDLGQQDGGQDPDRDADAGGHPDHDERAEDGVPEAAADLEAGGRQVDERIPGQPRASAHDQHVQDRDERHAGDEGSHPRPHGESPPGQATHLEPRPPETVGVVRQRPDVMLQHAHRLPSRLDAPPMIHSPATLTTSVMARRTRAAYISTWASRGPASGKFRASRAASVFAGANNDSVSWFEFPMSIASAIVSPRARPKPSTSAPKIPVAAVGSMTPRMASQRVAPMPYAASFTR